VSLVPAALAVIVGVKNGPPGMWRALESPDLAPPVVGFVTSLPWIAALTCGYVLLAAVISRRLRQGASSPESPLVVATAVLGALLVIALVANSVVLGFLLPAALIAAWVALLDAELGGSSARTRRSKRPR